MNDQYAMAKTSAKLESMTAQQVFDFVAHHLLTQGKPARETATGHCEYRLKVNDETFMCAAGCLIEDDEYESGMEGMPWSMLILCQKVTPVHEDLIYKLQQMHDNVESIVWRMHLVSIASEFNLNAKVVQDV